MCPGCADAVCSTLTAKFTRLSASLTFAEKRTRAVNTEGQILQDIGHQMHRCATLKNRNTATSAFTDTARPYLRAVRLALFDLRHFALTPLANLRPFIIKRPLILGLTPSGFFVCIHVNFFLKKNYF